LARIPGVQAKSGISKIDIVDAHLTSAVQMIAVGCDPVSVHIVVMACEELVSSVANDRGIVLEHDFRFHIKDEHHKDWLNLNRKAYNFFKHADRDANEIYSKLSRFELMRINDLKLLLNFHGHKSIVGTTHELFLLYATVQQYKNPAWFRTEWMDTYPEVKRGWQVIMDDPIEPELLLRDLLIKIGRLPKF
jgi:hypothetical protein